MPNTNPADLDREALKAACAATLHPPIVIRRAIEAYLTALPRASSVPEAEAVRYAAQFLVDRLEDFELDETNAKEMCRQYLGFVEPAIDRLKMELASPIASEPKDATLTAKQAYRAGFKAAQVWAKVDEIEAAGKAEPKDAGSGEARPKPKVQEVAEALHAALAAKGLLHGYSPAPAPSSPTARYPKDAGSGKGRSRG